VPTVPSDPVQPGASLPRAANLQAGPQPGEASPFEALLGTGHSPPAQAPSKPVHASRAATTSQSAVPAASASPLRAPLPAPGTLAPPPTDGSNEDERSGLVEDSDQRVRVAVDATGATAARLPVQTLADAAVSAPTNGAPMAADRDSSAPDQPPPATPDHPLPGTPAHKSEKASANGGDAGTVGVPAPGPIGSVTQPVAGPTIPQPAVTAPASMPALAPAATGPAPAPATPQSAAVPAAAAAPATVSGLGSALANSVTTATLTTPEPTSLPLDPTAPTSAASPGDKADNGTADSDDVAVVKPTQALASTIAPMASSGTANESVESAYPPAHTTSGAAPAANGANHTDATLAGSAHVDPPGDGPASPSVAAGPSGTAPSAAPPVSANAPVPATGAPLAAAPATSSPSSPATVPISGLAIEIAARATRDEKSFQIRLDPPELGRIDVELNVDASGHVTTHLTADRPETLNLLRQDASSLQRALESTGLKAGSGGLEFSLRNQSFGGEAGGQRGGQSNSTTSPIARIIVSDEDMPAGQTAARGYARLSGVGAGVDIRV
jgi:flagellar hook-length control protein FliK